MRDMTNIRHSVRALQVLTVIASAAAIGCSSNDGANTTTPQSVAGQNRGFAGQSGVAGQSAGIAGHAGAMGPMPGLGMLMTTPPPPTGTNLPVAGASGSLPGGGAAGHAGAGALTTGGAGQAGVAGSAGSLAGAAGAAGGGMLGGAGTSGAVGPDGMDPTSVCMGGKPGMDSTAAMVRGTMDGRNFAFVQYLVKSPNTIARFQTILTAPKVPTAKSTLFIWPGLQHSSGNDPARIGNGVLQPVLTWGPSCNPKASGKGSDYKGWWISAMYVNISSAAAGPGGCAGGDAMDVAVGDRMYIDFAVKGTEWTQTVTNLTNMKTVNLTTDLKGQDQTWAIWDIEVPGSSRPLEDTYFEKSVLTFTSPVTSCQPSSALLDTFSAPVLSPDGLNCCYDKMTLKAK